VDEATRQSRPTVEAEQKSPEELRRDIEETRGELGDTVEALAHKTDVKAQARERVDSIKAKVQSATPDSASGGAKQVTATAQRNPLPFAVGGALLAGFVIGRITSR
jgi:hypothetical protein